MNRWLGLDQRLDRCTKKLQKKEIAGNLRERRLQDRHLIGCSNAEFNVLLVERNAVEHGLYALARTAPALMYLHD